MSSIEITVTPGSPVTVELASVGIQGREVELSMSATHIQWRREGDDGWTDLVLLDDLKGADSTVPGEPGPPPTVVVVNTVAELPGSPAPGTFYVVKA